MAGQRLSPQYKAFLHKLRQAREDARMTQYQAAKSLHKPQSYVSKCESGERRVDVVELQDFAHLYNKDIRYFLEEE